MIGSGEYTTGFVGTGASKSDKMKGVVALVMFDLRRRGVVDQISCAGTSGGKWPAVRSHLRQALAEYKGLDLTMATYPADGKTDPLAYKAAIDQLQRGDAITVFTPDDTHFDIICPLADNRAYHFMTPGKALESGPQVWAAHINRVLEDQKR